MDGLDQRIAGPKAYNPKVNVMEWGCIVEKNSICKQRLSTPSNVGPDEITAAIPCKSKVLDLFRSFTLHSDKFEVARDYHPTPPPHAATHAHASQCTHTLRSKATTAEEAALARHLPGIACATATAG